MTEQVISDWKSLNDILEQCIHKDFQEILNRFSFRGQSNNAWKLESSISRIVKGDEISEQKAIHYEKQGLIEFKSLFHLTNEKLVFNSDMGDEALFIDMQHYSCPTRFIDWSRSPFVALYFAVNDAFENDSALYIWDYFVYLRNVKQLHPGFKDLPVLSLFEFKEFDHVQIALPTRKNERMYRQQGLFSISNNILKPHCEVISDIGRELSTDSGLFKITIPYSMKIETLDRLRYMNITASSLFPSLDGIGREIKESLLLRKWRKK